MLERRAQAPAQHMSEGTGVRRQQRKAVVGKRPANASRAVDYGTLAEFRYQLRKFLAFSETAAQESGLTPQQHQALLAIKGFSNSEPISVGDLARFLLIRHHTAVELMDRMTKLGLLSRIVDADDGRRVLVKLTRKGEQKLRTLSKIHFEELTTASPALTRILKSFQRSQLRWPVALIPAMLFEDWSALALRAILGD
jgi:DNA-binding MarR family transcriptional regulator